MTTTLEVYQCEKTKAAIEIIKAEGIQPAKGSGPDSETVQYKGIPLKFLPANTSEGASEKHMPVAAFEGEKLIVKVGDVMHPMTSEHLIEWVTIVYDNFVQHGAFCSEQSPQITFHVGKASSVDVYAYCNLHGLWKVHLDR